ncbi:MAG: hypothetical protein NXI04_06840 [Planctomycetaceae bacterium]|nr:hypothetical protein [Planctomycetaceae bacterium]
MLLTNTQNTLTTNITTGNGNVIVCGVEFGGCSACRPDFADRLSDKRAAAKRISAREMPLAGGMHPMHPESYSSDSSWQTPWQRSASLLTTALGCRFSLS